MSRLQCPVDPDLMNHVRDGSLEARDAAIYTACRVAVKLSDEVDDLKKKLDELTADKKPDRPEPLRSVVECIPRGS